MKKAVFLDRDGTIVEDLDFLTDLAELRLFPNAAQAIRRLNDAGYFVVVVTNQSGVARGFLSEKTLQSMHQRLLQMISSEAGAKIDAFYYCPHHPTIGSPQYRMDCPCRKPKPGMYLQAASEHDIDLAQSFAIGDSLRDGQAARAAGIAPLLIKTGPNVDEALAQKELFLGVADDLSQAVGKILNRKP